MKTGLLLLSLIAVAQAVEESCMGRCEKGFDSLKECQCDSLCKYYKSCCSDYEPTCRMTTRGDTFVLAEDDDEYYSPGDDAPSTASPLTTAVNASRRGSPTAEDVQTPAPTRRPVPTRSASPTRRAVPTRRPVPTRSASPTRRAVPTRPPIPAPPVPARSPDPTRAAPEDDIITTAATTQAPTTTAEPDPDADICSGRPFNSFTQLKNGSIFAFRGEYFFELDHKTVLPGYPKRIKDVWGISGPIDAAFTRVNCQGKTYIFKGRQYWRFDDGVMDEGYPRQINVGFDKVPDHLDAAFSLPSPGHHDKEKAYFFRGDEYFVHEFVHQPSHEECVAMSESSPSTLFRRYTDMYRHYADFFSAGTSADGLHHHSGHHFINKDWKGVKSPVDAVLTGRIYVSNRGVAPPPSPPRHDWDQQRQYGQQYSQQYGQQHGQQQYGQQYDQQYGQQQYQQYGQQQDRQRGLRRQRRSTPWGSMAGQGMAMGQGFAERGMEMGLQLAERRMEMERRFGADWDRLLDRDQDRRRDGYRHYTNGNYDSRPDLGRGDRAYLEALHPVQPVQNVYFFKADKYYRVDLKTKRVDPASPPYPRSIAKYWLGCSTSPDPPGPEK